MTTICCKCLKTKTDDGWAAKDDQETDALSHGYCPACYRETIKKIQDYRRQPNDAPPP